MTGLEPARHVANAPKAFVSTIPPHRHMVRSVGLEPTSLMTYDPQSYAYSNSATTAIILFIINITRLFMSFLDRMTIRA